jgi:hypothetical protein
MDTNKLFHSSLTSYWFEQHVTYQKTQKHNMLTRFERSAGFGAIKRTDGDDILEKLQDLFLNGFGIVWSSVQVKIFQALVDSLLPRIYGNEWESVKGRVLAQRNLDRMCQETLVNMARRNGKTWVKTKNAVFCFYFIFFSFRLHRKVSFHTLESR